jgi:Tol biopolymer transport system component
MTLSTGTRLGAYEIVSPLGAGGMGEVYRAKDTKLGRDVAVKVLPEEFFEDEERRLRFEREARTLASLNHPGIAAIHSFEEIPGAVSSSSRHLLVMELVEGEDLGQRLLSGPIPLEESLSLARQIADALEAAHEKGIVHRDLKPANVKVTPDGRVKLLDFGLAKIFEPVSDASGGASGARLTQSPTLSARATAAGVILGTAAYMSPEQARGKAVDKRTDVWAFGCVVYEMLTGKKAFAGETVTDVLAAVLTKEPDWNALPEQVPDGVRRVLRRCLQRDVKLRLRDIGDARLDLEDVAAFPASPGPSPFDEETALAGPAVGRTASANRAGGGARRFPYLPWGIAAAGVAAALAIGLRARVPAPAGVLVRASLPPPADNIFAFGGRQPGPPSVSPDGSRVVTAATRSDGGTQLWVRALGSEAWTALPGTDNGSYPFWSPDGKSIGFFADGKLKRVGSAGGPAITLGDAPYGKGGTWNGEGTILFAPRYDSGLLSIPAVGGQVLEVTKVDRARHENSHRFPQFLPDGRRYLYLARTSVGGAGDALMAGSLDGEPPREVLKTSTNAAYAAGQLLYVRDGALVARRLDSASLRFSGGEAVVAADVDVRPTASLAVFSASPAGVLVYDRASGSPLMVLRWFDRSGRETGTVGEPGPYYEAALSPDGRRVAVSAEDPKTGRINIFVLDVERGTAQRLTSGASESSMPHWTPDGSRIVFRAREAGLQDIFEKGLTGGEKTLLLRTDADKEPFDVSADGRTLAFGVANSSIWMLPLSPLAAPVPFLTDGYDEQNACFSPDGRWLAFESSEAGGTEVYVTSFPKAGAHVQVSSGGGRSPRWSADGRELFYLAPGNALMSAAVRPESGGSIDIRTPSRLFVVPGRIYGSDVGQGMGQSYDVRGGRFLFLLEQGSRERHPLTLVANWPAALGLGR